MLRDVSPRYQRAHPAKNHYYAFDIAPGFWAWLDRAHQESIVCSVEAVGAELRDGTDELSRWARDNPDFFRPIDQATADEFAPLSAWAASGRFTPEAQSRFTGDHADYLLVAYARAHAFTVVTQELASPQATTKIKIPDACAAMGVVSIGTFEMLRQAQIRLALPRPTD